MKCAACGYEHRKSYHVPYKEAVLYKAGKKKGQLKEIKDSQIRIEGNEPFIKIEFPVSFDTGAYWDISKVSLYACPECSTVRMESYW